jgi:energy-coupling factor transport system substrate-specific component
MAGLPNIEPVTLCLLVYGAVFGYKALYPAYVYVIMEILYFGLGTWNFCYFYVWAIPVVCGFTLRRMKGRLGWALVSAVFGLMFGALCGIVDAFIGGIGYAVAKWASGIPFDIAHCLGNFGIALVMFKPLRELLDKLYGKMRK